MLVEPMFYNKYVQMPRDVTRKLLLRFFLIRNYSHIFVIVELLLMDLILMLGYMRKQLPDTEIVKAIISHKMSLLRVILG